MRELRGISKLPGPTVVGLPANCYQTDDNGAADNTSVSEEPVEAARQLSLAAEPIVSAEQLYYLQGNVKAACQEIHHLKCNDAPVFTCEIHLRGRSTLTCSDMDFSWSCNRPPTRTVTELDVRF